MHIRPCSFNLLTQNHHAPTHAHTHARTVCSHAHTRARARTRTARYQVEQDQGILEFAAKMGDLLVEQLGGDPKKLYALQAWEENDAILHGMALLYSTTGKKAYLDFCNVILLEFQMPPCGDYVRNALAGKQYYEGSQPRWEGLHAVLGIAEMAWITGDKYVYSKEATLLLF